MGKPIEDRHRELFEEPNFGYVATLRSDGTPWVVPVWVDIEDDLVLLNTSEGRAWPGHLRRDPRVTLTVADRNNPYRWVSIKGRVVEDTHDGALAHIHKMAMKYMGEETYPFLEEGEQRVVFKVEAEQVASWDPTLLGGKARAYLAGQKG
jgi:PPOX class probable F420-dependent enzyme